MQSDIVTRLMDYEDGDLDFDQTVALFQDLVNSGLAWSLQGTYGRTAKTLIDYGYVTAPNPDDFNVEAENE